MYCPDGCHLEVWGPPAACPRIADAVYRYFLGVTIACENSTTGQANVSTIVVSTPLGAPLHDIGSNPFASGFDGGGGGGGGGLVQPAPHFADVLNAPWLSTEQVHVALSHLYRGGGGGPPHRV